MTAPPTIPCPVAACAASEPQRPALRTLAETVSYGAWHRQICDWEFALRAMGVSAGTRVALAVPDPAQMLTLLVALFRTGAAACPIDPAFPAAYRESLEKRLDCARSINETTPSVSVRGADIDPENSLWDIEGPATIIFTSGSSGTPKAAVLSLANHLASAQHCNRTIPLGRDDTWLLSLPLHHVAGFGILFRCLEAGAAIALPGDLPLEEAIVTTGATHVSLVARQLARLIDTGPLSPLKAILLGGSAIPAPLLDRAVGAGLPVHTSYGMTETAAAIAATPPGAPRAALDSAGIPLAPGTVRIGPDDRIQVNGPPRFLGYWEGDALLQPFDSGGWFTTGDCGRFDAEGLLHVTGRADNMFISGGENIQPEEIERALLRLPGIVQAVVVPVPHPEFGTTPVAFVECEAVLNADAIRDALSAVLPRFKVPRHIFSWPPDIAGEGIKVNRGAFATVAERLVGRPL